MIAHIGLADKIRLMGFFSFGDQGAATEFKLSMETIYPRDRRAWTVAGGNRQGFA
jgi:hypothetical protein